MQPLILRRCSESRTKYNKFRTLSDSNTHSLRRYRKSKRKFDVEVRKAILLQDTTYAIEDLEPLKSTATRLYNAFVHNDITPTKGWNGLESTVRKKYKGKHALQLEVVEFVLRVFVKPLFMVRTRSSQSCV